MPPSPFQNTVKNGKMFSGDYIGAYKPPLFLLKIQPE